MLINHVRLKEIFLSTGLLLLSAGLLLSGCGLMNTLLPLKLTLSGESSLLIGFISAVYFVGMLIGSLKTSVLIKSIGYVKSYTTLAAIIAIATTLPSMKENLYLWFICRFIQGFCLAGLYIVIESWILCSCSENNRGKTLGIYSIVLFLSYALGQFFLTENTIDTFIPFCTATILIVSSIIPLSIFPVTPPILEEHANIKIKKVYDASPAGFLGCIVSGCLISTIFSIFPIYIEEVVNDTQQISIILALTFLSGVVVQYPLGVLSDKLSRQKIQIVLNTMFTAFLAVFIFLEYKEVVNFYTLLVISVMIGTFSFSIYPITMNLVCDNIKKSEVIQATEVMMIAYGFGSIIGPIYSSFSMEALGFLGYPASYLTLTLFLAIFTISVHRKSTREKQIPIEEISTPLVPYTSITIDSMECSSESKTKHNKVD
jgi:MFS family permease